MASASSAGGTKVLFVPYRPSSASSSSTAPSFRQTRIPLSEEDDAHISQQKHAAREYHRKAKLQRYGDLGPSKKKPPRRRSTKVESSWEDGKGRSPPKQDALSLGRGHDGLPDGTKARGVEYHSFVPRAELGAGQLDPFSAVVPKDLSPYHSEMLEHAISYQWPVFSNSKTVASVGNIKNDVLACAMVSPASFYTIIFAGATHNAYLHTGMEVTPENKVLRLSFKFEAIKALNAEICSLRGEPSDALLLSMITLAAHGSGEQLVPPGKENPSPLARAQNFQYYGSMKWELAHLKAIRLLIRKKGGLDTVKMSGLANAIQLADIFIAFQYLSRPVFPLLKPTSVVMSSWPNPPSSLLLRSCHNDLCTGFDSLPSKLTSSPLFSMIHTIRTVTIGFSMYCSGHPQAPSLAHIIWARNSIQHDLLSLPPTISPPSDLPLDLESSCLYELIRFGVLGYTLLVLFPMPRVTTTHAKLAQQLMQALDDCTLLNLWDQYPGLLLWTTVIGGILSHCSDKDEDDNDGDGSSPRNTPFNDNEDDDDYSNGSSPLSNKDAATSVLLGSLTPYFIRTTTRPGVKQELSAWGLVRDLCGRFLWFEGDECEGAGKEFWRLACESILPRYTNEWTNE